MRARPMPCTSTRIRPSGQLQHPHDEGHRAHRVDVVGPGVLLLLLLLGGEEDHAVLAERVVHRLDRAVAAHVERDDHEGEDHDVPQGENGQDLRDLRGLLVLLDLFGHPSCSHSMGIVVSRPRRSLRRGRVTMRRPPLEPRAGRAQVHRTVEGDRPLEAAAGPLQAEVVLARRRPAGPPLAADHDARAPGRRSSGSPGPAPAPPPPRSGVPGSRTRRRSGSTPPGRDGRSGRAATAARRAG